MSVLAHGSLFYCDLISGADSRHAREFAGEETVDTSHERGTIQSYFNYSKILALAGDLFEVTEALLIQREDELGGRTDARHHIAFRRR